MPRIPIWVAAAWNRTKSMQRALRYDGGLPNPLDEHGNLRPEAPGDIAQIRQNVREHRTVTTPFEIIVEGVTPGDDATAAAAIVGPGAEAGATWWIESRWGAPNQPADLRRRIGQGPPRLH
jgi:hypothetical protein